MKDNFYTDGKPCQFLHWSYILWVILFFAVFVTIFVGITHKEARAQVVPDIDLNIIAKIESNFNPLAYNLKTQATGLFQITPICLKDWNLISATPYTMQDMFVAEKNLIVATWYLTRRIPQMLKYYGIEDNIDNRLIAYNFGIGNLIRYTTKDIKLPKETQNYIKKYKRLAGLK